MVRYGIARSKTHAFNLMVEYSLERVVCKVRFIVWFDGVRLIGVCVCVVAALTNIDYLAHSEPV